MLAPSWIVRLYFYSTAEQAFVPCKYLGTVTAFERPDAFIAAHRKFAQFSGDGTRIGVNRW